MSALTFRLRGDPPERLDLALLTPARLAGLSDREIAGLPINTGRGAITVGDVFAITAGEAADIRFEGGSTRFDRLGEGMAGGVIRVAGDVGWRAGRGMSGGTLTVEGSAGGLAGSGMAGGTLRVEGDAGAMLGAPLAGEMAGMSGGAIRVRGSAGARTADRMRRGTIVVAGDIGADAASRMIAGTLVVGGAATGRPGRLMKRGTLVLMGEAGPFGPTFRDNGVADLLALRVMARTLGASAVGPVPFDGAPMRRFSGDTAVLGMGEIFRPS